MKIAIGIDLEWSFEHHYKVIEGILELAYKKGWECTVEPWLGANP